MFEAVQHATLNCTHAKEDRGDQDNAHVGNGFSLLRRIKTGRDQSLDKPRRNDRGKAREKPTTNKAKLVIALANCHAP